MQTPEEFAWTLYAEEMDFHDHCWYDTDATVRLIAARDAAVAAKAWGEGFDAGAASEWAVDDDEIYPPNPYRIEREAGCADCTDPA